jgi:predicted O-methyltransferase YrrM
MIPHFHQEEYMGENVFTYPEFYGAIARWIPNGGHAVEVGSYLGRSIACLAVEIHNLGKNVRIDCVDMWNNDDFKRYWNSSEENLGDNVYTKFLKNIEPIKHLINVIRGDSADSASLFEDRSLDFVFIDADHRYESVLRDALAWKPKIKSGGIIAGHDYGWCGDVRRAVGDAFGPHDDWTVPRAFSSDGGCFMVRMP